VVLDGLTWREKALSSSTGSYVAHGRISAWRARGKNLPERKDLVPRRRVLEEAFRLRVGGLSWRQGRGTVRVAVYGRRTDQRKKGTRDWGDERRCKTTSQGTILRQYKRHLSTHVFSLSCVTTVRNIPKRQEGFENFLRPSRCNLSHARGSGYPGETSRGGSAPHRRSMGNGGTGCL